MKNSYNLTTVYACWFFNSLELVALYIGEAPQKERGRTIPGLGIGVLVVPQETELRSL